MAKNQEKYSWPQFDSDVRKIAVWAKKKRRKNIYGFPRGGLVLGVALSHRLNIPIVLDKEDISNETLVVDDIVDSGETVRKLLLFLSAKPLVASIYLKDGAKTKPNFFLRAKKSKWIHFPWEKE